MISIDLLLSMIAPKEQKKALITIYPVLNSEVQSDVALRIAKYDEQEKSINEAFDHICECVTMVTGITDIRNTTSRRRSEVVARQMVIYCACAEFVDTKKLTLMQVGGYFAKCYNHALILHCRKSIRDLYATDKQLRDHMDTIAECLYQSGLIYSKVCLTSIK
jgi:chromosomal replication initiation ATPase DnaA